MYKYVFMVSQYTTICLPIYMYAHFLVLFCTFKENWNMKHNDM